MPKPNTWYTALNLPTWSPSHGRNRRTPSTPHSRSTDRADQSAGAGADTYSVTIGQPFTLFSEPKPPKPPTISYAGVRAGELIGHRAWVVLENLRLCSLSHYFIWEPEATIHGDIDTVVSNSIWYKTIWGGVYSFTNHKLVMSEFGDYRPEHFPTKVTFTRNLSTAYGIAIGTIKCWGEVIEHEHGYRAEYAKLHTIDCVIGKVDIAALRQRYLPNGQ